MHSEILSYEADGLHMQSIFHVDSEVTGKRPAILVFPEIWGLGDNARTRARRLAELGYAVLACDLHGEGRLRSDAEAVMNEMGEMMRDPSRIRARAIGGLQALAARPETDTSRIAAMGFCFGGTMALELARSGADIKGVVGFHSGLATARPQDASSIKGKILVCIGADDPSIPPAQRAAFEQEMREGGADWQMNVYGGVVHSFTNKDADRMGRPESARYDANADTRSWAEMLRLFGEIFK